MEIWLRLFYYLSFTLLLLNQFYLMNKIFVNKERNHRSQMDLLYLKENWIEFNDRLKLKNEDYKVVDKEDKTWNIIIDQKSNLFRYFKINSVSLNKEKIKMLIL